MAKQTSTLPQYQYKRKHGFFYNLKKYRVLTLMCVPAIVFFFAFNYMPLPGIYVAFVKYNYRDGIFGSKFVGMKNFEFLMQSGKLLGLTKNTILYNLAFIFLGNIIAMLMAVLLNEIHNKYFKKVSQTLMFLPYFISQVLVGFLVFNLLNYDTGFINGILVKLGMEKWQPYSDKSVWPPILIVVYLWQVTGYNSVVYFASICGIDTSIIEAARVDGANCFQKILLHRFCQVFEAQSLSYFCSHSAGIVKGNFGLFYNIVGTNPMLYETTDIIETYVYRSTITDFNFSTASAVGLYQSIIGFCIVMASNFAVKKIDPEYALF